MPNNLSRRKKIGLAMFAGGVALTLVCHLGGSWELLKHGGNWRSIHSEELQYDIPCYDAGPDSAEVGRVVIHRGFAASAQVYFPLALSLLRSGYSVRLIANSGSPNSKVPMRYEYHSIEAMEAAHDFLAAGPDSPHFLIGHSEGTRYALEGGYKIPSVDGIVLLSTVSAAMDGHKPANVLMLVADNDFVNVKRQTNLGLINGTGRKRPKFGKLYGDLKQGTARMAEVLPDTNHVSVFLNDGTQRAILSWINQISGNAEDKPMPASGGRLVGLALCALLGLLFSVVGIGLIFPRTDSTVRGNSIPAWALLVLTIMGWGGAAFVGNSLAFVQKIPLLVYARVLVFMAIAAVPLAVVVLIRPRLGIGVPRGPWKARTMLVGLATTMLLFDRWLTSVIPAGQRLLWFGLAILITGGYFACDEFLRRAIQRATDWQTGLALGLAGAFIAAVSVAGAAFFVGAPVGQFLVGGAVTLFVLMVACEFPATYLFATTGDWLLAWCTRVCVFNGFLAGMVPLVAETEFRHMVP